MIKNTSPDKGHSVTTILTSDSELMLNTYMVTPTTTGGPEITISPRQWWPWALLQVPRRYRLARPSSITISVNVVRVSKRNFDFLFETATRPEKKFWTFEFFFLLNSRRVKQLAGVWICFGQHSTRGNCMFSFVLSKWHRNFQNSKILL